MEKDKTVWHFEKFLLEHKVYKNFIDCVESKDNYFREEYDVLSLKHLLKAKHPHQWIAFAFDWSKTLQGHNFWENLDCQWQKTVNNLNRAIN